MASSLVSSVLGWLRQGYADGVPRQDVVPLLEVLHRRLTDTEVRELVNTIVETQALPITLEDIERAAQERLLMTPGDEDLARVASHLAAGGWPLSALESAGSAGEAPTA